MKLNRSLLAFAALLALGAQAQPVVVTGSISALNAVPLGTATPNSAVEIISLNKGLIGVQVKNTWVGTLTGYCTLDSITWMITSWVPVTANGISNIDGSGCIRVRVAASAWTSGQADLVLQATSLSAGGGGSSGGTATSGKQDTQIAAEQAIQAAIGATTDAAVGDANGTVNAHVRNSAKYAPLIQSDTSRITSSTGGKAPTAPLATTAIQVGGTYNATAPTLTDTQEGGLQITSRGGLIVAGGAAVGAAPLSNPVSVAGIDNAGNKQHLLTKVDGTMQTNDAALLAKFTATANADSLRIPTQIDLGSSTTTTATASGVAAASVTPLGRSVKSIIFDVSASTDSVNFESSVDGGTTYRGLSCWPYNGNGSSGRTGGTSASATGRWNCPGEGTHARFTKNSGAGSVTVTILPSMLDFQGVGVVVVGNALTTAGTGATGTAISGSGFRITGTSRTSSPTLVASGSTSEVELTQEGKVVVLPLAIPEQTWNYAAASGGETGTGDLTIAAAPAAGLRNYVSSCVIQNASATIATEVVLKDGATVLKRFYVGVGSLLNSVVSVIFSPAVRQPTTATALTGANMTTASQVYWNCNGYTGP